MKLIKGTLVLQLPCMIVMYLIVAFITWCINPAEWILPLRIVYVFGSIIFFFINGNFANKIIKQQENNPLQGPK